jgi:hypothetical protein
LRSAMVCVTVADLAELSGRVPGMSRLSPVPQERGMGKAPGITLGE